MRSLKIQVLIHRFTTFEHIIQEIYISFYLQLLDHYRITTIQKKRPSRSDYYGKLRRVAGIF